MAAFCKSTVFAAVLVLFVACSSAHPNILEGREVHYQPFGPHGHPPSTRFWVPCNVTETPEPICASCDTRLVCTKLGGFLIPCWWPGQRHCVEGECGPEPSEQCESTPPPPPLENETTEPAGTTATVSSTVAASSTL